MPLKIVICGGGMGGLAVAGFLRAQHHVTVLERELDYGTNDYGLSIVTNAFTLLQKAGIKIENLDGAIMTHLWVRDNQCKELRTVHFDTRRERGGAPSVMARRANIQRELLRFATSTDFSGKPAEVLQGAKVTRVDAEAGKVWIEDGRVFEGDLIIGADGINSVVRPAVLNESPPGSLRPVKYHDLMIYITRVPIETIKSTPEFAFLANPSEQAGLVSFHMPDESTTPKRMMMYHTSTHEIQVLGFAAEKEFAEKFDQGKTAIIHDVPASRVVPEFTAEFGEKLVGLFNHGRIDAWRIRDIDTCDTWFRGKAVLIGDAAHAVTPHAGHGCNITIEDAEALSYLLRESDSSDDLTQVLEKFVSLRKDRANYVLRRSREIGRIQTEEDKKLGPITGEEFSRVMHSYQGVEQVLKAAETTAVA